MAIGGELLVQFLVDGFRDSVFGFCYTMCVSLVHGVEIVDGDSVDQGEPSASKEMEASRAVRSCGQEVKQTVCAQGKRTHLH